MNERHAWHKEKQKKTGNDSRMKKINKQSQNKTEWRQRGTGVENSIWNINPLFRECTSFQSVWSPSKSAMSSEWDGLVSEWRHSSTHYLLLFTVGGKALGQQGTILQQHFGDRLWKEDNTHFRQVCSGSLWRHEAEHWYIIYSLSFFCSTTRSVWTQVKLLKLKIEVRMQPQLLCGKFE